MSTCRSHLRYGIGVNSSSILYSLNMAARGESGIPSETKQVAALLVEVGFDVDFILVPSSHSLAYKNKKFDIFSQAQLVSDFLNVKHRKGPVQKIRQAMRELTSSKRLKLMQLNSITAASLVDYLSISKTANLKSESKYFSTKRDLASIYGRSAIGFRNVIDTSGYPLYIQQHIDPIHVSQGTKQIIRLHDVLPLTHPAYFKFDAIETYGIGLRTLINQKNITFVTDTNSQAEVIKRLFGQELDVRVIGCPLRNDPSPLDASKTKRIRNQFLVVNTLEPRKQTRLIVESFEFLVRTHRLPKESKLIIVGKHGWLQETLVHELANSAFGKNVKWYESVTEMKLSELYYQSEFVISASMAEGFGLPPLEGAVRGAIPVVSNIPSHVENLGCGAIYFDPTRIDSLLNAFQEAYSMNPRKKRSIIESNRKALVRFSREQIGEDWKELIYEFVNLKSNL